VHPRSLSVHPRSARTSYGYACCCTLDRFSVRLGVIRPSWKRSSHGHDGPGWTVLRPVAWVVRGSSAAGSGWRAGPFHHL